jgi:SPP1 gp7 family putative phage head morphogenesis protein
MPVHKVRGGFRFGETGKVYPSRAGAEAQARAIYSTGWREDRAIRKAVKALRASRRGEAGYVMALARIMAQVYRGIMQVVEREHLAPPELHEDAELERKPPLVRQATEFSCGAAAVLSVLRLYAPEVWNETAERELYEPLGTTPEDGTEPQAMADFLAKELGHAVVRSPSSIRMLEEAIDQGRPAIVDVQAWREGKTSWEGDWDDGHYLVLAGYNASSFLFMDPATAGAYGYIPRAELYDRWHDVLRDGTRVRRLAIFMPVRQDAAPPPVGLSDRLAHRLVRFVAPAVQTAFDEMADDVDSNAEEGLKLIGIAPRAVAGLASVIDHARAENVRLITRASTDMLAKVRRVLEEGEGERPETIRDRLAQLDGISRRRGMLIARDQTGKLNAAMVQHRARAAGLSKYRWSGALDERERPMHLALEGQVFSWDDPPVTNEDEERNHPGEDYQCRCVPLPFIEELEEGEEEGEEGEEEEDPDEEEPPPEEAEEGDE